MSSKQKKIFSELVCIIRGLLLLLPCGVNVAIRIMDMGAFTRGVIETKNIYLNVKEVTS